MVNKVFQVVMEFYGKHCDAESETRSYKRVHTISVSGIREAI